MKPFSVVRSAAVAVLRDEVDTDQIIPAAFLTSVSRDGYGENLFRGLRDADPAFPLNDPKLQGREILVAGANFGCGSSREHAVWALTGCGFQVVIAKSFADIFSGNSAKNGLLLVQLPAEVVDAIAERAQHDDEYYLVVDLPEQRVTDSDGVSHSFEYDPFRKHCLLNGLDDVDYIRSKGGEISAFRSTQEKRRYVQRAPLER